MNLGRVWIPILLLLGQSYPIAQAHSKHAYRVATAQELTLNHQCAVALCGAPRSNLEMLSNGAVLPPQVEQNIQNSIDPLARSLIDLRLQQKSVVAGSIQSLLQRYESESLVPMERAVVNMAVVFSVMMNLSPEEQLRFLVAQEDGTYQLKESELLKKYPQLNNQQGRNLIAALQAYFASPLLMRLQGMDSRMSMPAFIQAQSNLTGCSNWTCIAGYLQSQMKTLDRAGVGLLIEASGRRLVGRVLKQGTMALSERKAFIGLFLQVNSLMAISMDPLLEKMTAAHLSADQIRSITGIQDSAHWTSGALKDSLNSYRIVEKLTSQLRQSIRQWVASGLTPADAIVGQKMLAAVRTRALEILDSQIYDTGGEGQRARDAILAVSFDLPMGQDEVYIQVLRQMNDEVSDERERLVKMRHAVDGGPGFAVVLALAVNDLEKQSRAIDQIVPVDELLQSYSPPALEDAAYGGVARIRISWQSMKNRGYGAGIFAHELAHVASRAMSPTIPLKMEGLGYDGAIPVKACTVNRHRISKTLVDVNLPLAQAEEDWADTFATAVLQSYIKDGAQMPNYGCLLLDYNQKTKDFGSLQMRSDLDGDSHSSGFYRLLQIQVGLGSTPDVCRKATGLPTNSLFFQSCVR